MTDSINDNNSSIEEEDITDSFPNTVQQDSHHSPQPAYKQLDSESEQDVTEEINALPTLMYFPLAVDHNKSASNVKPATNSSRLLPRSQRVWEMDRQTLECRRCQRRFNFLIRRHHCRRCGQIICDKCSSNRIRLPVEELIEDPIISKAQYPVIALQSQRVCDRCYREPLSRSIHYMTRTKNSQSFMVDCPVCNQPFLGLQKKEQEDHLHHCLTVKSPPVHAPKYLIYKLSNDSQQIGVECPICFDEFLKGDEIARMVCLCSYHQHCLSSWLQKGKGCPVHYDSLLS